MLTIRSAQMESFQAQAYASFRERMVDRLLTQSGTVQPAPAREQLARGVDEAVVTARGYGIRREDDVAQLLHVLWTLYGSLTPDLPADVQSVLHRWSDPQTKLRHLQKITGAEDLITVADEAERANSPVGSQTTTGRQVGAAVQPCPPAQLSHWIEIELIGEDDKGIAGEAYTLQMPDGTLVHGNLDDTGFVRLDGVATTGSCNVSFPALDKEAWTFIKATSARQATAL